MSLSNYASGGPCSSIESAYIGQRKSSLVKLLHGHRLRASITGEPNGLHTAAAASLARCARLFDPEAHVNKLTSILAVLDGSSSDVPLLAKAARLALAFGARVELFSCDSEQAYAARRSYDARGVHDAVKASVREQCRYLQRRAENIGMHNLSVSVDACCESPLYEGVVRKVFGSRPDLVMKATSGPGAERLATRAHLPSTVAAESASSLACAAPVCCSR